MKIRYKLSIIATAAIMVIVFSGASMQTMRTAALNRHQSLATLNQMSDYWMEFWYGRVQGHVRVLRTLADIMGNFEALPEGIRRDVFDEMMYAVISESPFFGINTLWMPNTIDNDEANIGRVGATETGQFGSAFMRELPGGAIEHRTLVSEAEMMAHMQSPQARSDRVEPPHSRVVPGRGEVWLTMISVPVINRGNDQVVAMMSILLDLELVQPQFISFYNEHPEVGLVAMYCSSGHIIASTAVAAVNANISDRGSLFGEQLAQVMQTVSAGQYLETSFFSPDMGGTVELIVDSFPIGVNSDITWGIAILKPHSVILAPVYAIVRDVAILVGSLVIITIIGSIVFFGKATKPLTWLRYEIGVLAEGDFRDVELYKYSGKDEISDLIDGFYGTQKSVKTLINKVRNESQGLSGIGETLSSNMTQTAAAVNQIATNVHSVKGRVINQSASVDQTSATMKQLVQNIDRLDGFISDQSNYVSTASSAVEEMSANIRSVTDTLVKNVANVKHLMEAAEVGRNGINEVATDIQEIARESAGLMEINTVMENIASQTNLLSMNAAIEAAHAGEAGKGFAVVADEIRKLAESSKEQSKTIGTVLKKIKMSIDKIALSNEGVLSKFEDIEAGIKIVSDQEENIRHAMEEQDVGSRQIVNGIIEITEITRKVKNGSSEMLVGANEVIRETGNLENATREITDSMNEMVSGTNQINTAVNHVNDLSNKNRFAIGVLMQEVSQFKV